MFLKQKTSYTAKKISTYRTKTLSTRKKAIKVCEGESASCELTLDVPTDIIASSTGHLISYGYLVHIVVHLSGFKDKMNIYYPVAIGTFVEESLPDFPHAEILSNHSILAKDSVVLQS
eukprot:NODE_10_length_47437_cov_0.363429.p29 type:complete len:118 gc:universal NODE_10_length_47437_cov_0.363429:41837-42190(+)